MLQRFIILIFGTAVASDRIPETEKSIETTNSHHRTRKRKRTNASKPHPLIKNTGNGSLVDGKGSFKAI